MILNLYKYFSLFKFYLFADNTNILYANKDLRTMERVVHTEVANLSHWLVANKLTLNTGSDHRLMSAFEFSWLQISFCVVKHYFKIMEEHELKSKHSFLKKCSSQQGGATETH